MLHLLTRVEEYFPRTRNEEYFALPTCPILGHYCGSNTTDTVEMLTGGGDSFATYDFAGQCFNGTWCPPGMTRPPDLLRDPCPAGYYCPSATPNPIACPSGTYNKVTGADELEDCVYTPMGYYTLPGASSYNETPCE